MVFYLFIAVLIIISILGDRYVFKLSQGGTIRFSVCFTMFILLFVSAFRDISVGADTFQYCKHFELISKMNFKEVFEYVHYWNNGSALELGYKYYNKLLSFLSHNEQTITISNSFLMLLTLYLMLKNFSPDINMSLYLYVAFGFFQTALNLTPSSIASYICMGALFYAKKKQAFKFFLIVLLTSLIHTSALAYLPIYFLLNTNWNKRKIIFAMLCTIFVALIGKYLIGIMSYIVPVKYMGYLLDADDNAISQFFVYINQAIIILMCMSGVIINKRKYEEYLRENSESIVMFYTTTIMYILNFMGKGFSRGAFIFSPFCIVIIPKIITYIEKPKLRKVMKVLTIAIAFAFFVVRLKVNNIGKTMPYSFFWQ